MSNSSVLASLGEAPTPRQPTSSPPLRLRPLLDRLWLPLGQVSELSRPQVACLASVRQALVDKGSCCRPI
jgi:hypothetical protein